MCNYIYKINILLFSLAICISCSSISNSHINSGELIIVKGGKVNRTLDKKIEPYEAKVNEEMGQIIGYSDTLMEKGKPESLLGNFIADLLLIKSKEYYKDTLIDFCIINNGGLRMPLPKGEITLSMIYELMPFENEIVVLTLEEPNLNEMFRFIANKEGMPI